MKRLALALFAALTVLVLAPAARAGAPGRTLLDEITPVFGAATPLYPGWNELVVRLSNTGASPARGHVELRAHTPFGSQRRSQTEAEYAVAPGASVMLRLPVACSSYDEVAVRVLDEAGAELDAVRYTPTEPSDVVLLDLHEPSLLHAPLTDTPIVPEYQPPSRTARGTSPHVRVGSPRVDPATGDFVLPDRASVYGSVDALLVGSDVLARLSGAELDALTGWVLGGGTLAVVVARPEDLRSATLSALVGSDAKPTAVAPETTRPLALAVGPSGAMGPKLPPEARSASDELAPTLAGYQGGNLHPSAYGASASYGLGEVHLLAFDPTKKPGVDDAWVHVRMIDLLRRAFDRRASVFLSSGESYDPDLVQVRRQLDPNESSRWGIAAAALLLVIYAVFAGPISFSRARRRGRPLRALRRLPLYALAAFVAIVAIGVFSKGIRGRARHLALVETGAGMSVGHVRRYRGFFASHSQPLTIRASGRDGVLATEAVSGSGDGDGVDRLVVDRDGARLVGVAALPWQTVVIREEAKLELGEGIAIVDGADVTVVNRSGRALRSAVLKLPGRDPVYFGRIEDGARVTASAGHAVDATPAESLWSGQIASPSSSAGALPIFPLVASEMPEELFDKDTPGVTAAWRAVDVAAGSARSFFPPDVPVLLAQLEGGEGRTSDAGLRLESDRLLVRVVGFGGRP